MILPVTAYGHPVLRRTAKEIEKDYPGLQELIDNMFETIYVTNGVGLAAPQVNLSIRLFIVDTTPYANEIPEAKGFKRVFINPEIIEEGGKETMFNEGCLSIPDIREDVPRKPNIYIRYYNENFMLHEERFNGVKARVILHEYEHLQGILFVDRVSNIRKILMRRKLQDISKGNINVDYKMIFPNRKKGKRK